uniref:Uncharacterized protein n=1 Tax=Ananas comosus var. bracteatus TaxID=296719 RepID=A0A6V7NNV8_ANACO|nr:unnamed protein product [Ananas comosus var. bracteatus]
MAKSKTKHLSYISFPSQIIPALSYSTLQSLVVSPKKLLSSSASSRFRINRIVSSSPGILPLLLALAFLGTLLLGPVIPFSPIPCAQDGVRSSSSSSSFPAAEGEFWRQPDGMGYRPCLSFSEEYRGGRRRVLILSARYLATLAISSSLLPRALALLRPSDRSGRYSYYYTAHLLPLVLDFSPLRERSRNPNSSDCV